MTAYVVWWTDAVVIATVQGGLSILLLWLLFRALPAIPAAGQVWMWRVVLVKLLGGLVIRWPMEAAFVPTPLQSGPAGENGAPVLALVTVGLWGLGALAWMLFVLDDLRSAMQLRSESSPCGRPDVTAIAEALSHRMGLRRAPACRQSSRATGPLVVGQRRPVVLLPVSIVDTVSASELEMLLAHELAHVRRRDLVWAWLPTLAGCVFFFHPLVWLARRELRIAQDSACDAQSVLTSRAAPADYARMLIRVARGATGSGPFAPLVAGVLEDYRSLCVRVQQLGRRRCPKAILSGTVLVLMIAAAMPILELSSSARAMPIAPPAECADSYIAVVPIRWSKSTAVIAAPVESARAAPARSAGQIGIAVGGS